MIWGDLRCSEEVATAVQDQEVIVHPGYIIPPDIEEDLEMDSERLLHYQRHSFDEIIYDVVQYNAPPAPVKLLMPLLRPLIRRWIVGLSPYVIG